MKNLKTNQTEDIPCGLDQGINQNVLQVSSLVLEHFLSDKECDDFLTYALSNHKLRPGLDRNNNPTTNRYSDISFIEENIDTKWLFDKLVSKIIPINDKFMRYNLTHLDRLQFANYSKDQYLDYHTDDYFDYIQINNEKRDLYLRKLSISIGLNDEYEGGEFELQNFKGVPDEPYDINKFKLNKGSAIIFPSFQLHKVHKVTSGCRQSLVAWFFGPKWC